MTHFLIGDLVRLRNGHAPMRIKALSLSRQTALCLYLSSERGGHFENARTFHVDKLIHYETPEQEPETMTPNVTLYVTKEETPRYGTFVSQHDGKIVLAMKGGDGEYQAFTPDAIEEVRPYTVSLRSFMDGREVHVEMKRGLVEKGDFLLHPKLGLVNVTAIDTRCKSSMLLAQKFQKLATEPLVESDPA